MNDLQRERLRRAFSDLDQADIQRILQRLQREEEERLAREEDTNWSEVVVPVLGAVWVAVLLGVAGLFAGGLFGYLLGWHQSMTTCF
jgi:hypothetical protein